jgi:hypothetical protein
VCVGLVTFAAISVGLFPGRPATAAGRVPVVCPHAHLHYEATNPFIGASVPVSVTASQCSIGGVVDPLSIGTGSITFTDGVFPFQNLNLFAHYHLDLTLTAREPVTGTTESASVSFDIEGVDLTLVAVPGVSSRTLDFADSGPIFGSPTTAGFGWWIEHCTFSTGVLACDDDPSLVSST